MYSLGSIAKRLVRDDAELGYEFGEDMSGYLVRSGSAFKALAVKVHSTATFRSGTQEK